jgi:gamma-glutamyltranspeptidase/glutathione hydrolase
MVASDHEVASEVGASVLARGGNAVDAAAATALTLGVVNPSSSGIGGGGFAVVWDADKKELYAIDFREVAPAGLKPDSFVVDGKLDTSLSRSGGLAVAVPGEVAGLVHLHTSLGSLEWKEVVAPAQRYAERGFRVGWWLAQAAAVVVDRLEPGAPLRRWLTPGGEPLAEGRWVRRSKLARTLQLIAEQGAAGFYGGPVADDIVKSVQARGGLLTRADLAAYKVIERTPLVGEWGEYRLATMPLPSSGGLALLAMLGIIDAADIELARLGHGSSATLHVIVEVLKHAFADRARFLGDARPAKLLAEQFLAKPRLERLARKLRRRVRPNRSYGDPGLGKAAATRPTGGTSHLCVIDAEGNAVALTTTVNGYFGSGVITSRSGVVLNNEVDDFSLRAGVPNMFGLVQSDYNLVGPGKRPLSSMTPVLVFKGDRVVGCAGGSGGPKIISNTFQVLLNIFVFGMNVREAVDAPRVHHQWQPDKLWVDKPTAADVVTALERRGHNVELTDRPSAVQAIVVDGDGVRHGASDPRKAGAPAATP